LTARFAALLGVLIVLAGCGVPGSAAPQSAIEGSTLHTINFGGLARSYRLYIPVGLARTTRRDDARWFRQRSAGRKSLPLE
jgi:polyhydroxybutyrate depolymerase